MNECVSCSEPLLECPNCGDTYCLECDGECDCNEDTVDEIPAVPI